MDSNPQDRATSGHDPSIQDAAGSTAEPLRVQPGTGGIDSELQTLAAQDAAERKRLRWALIGATVFHAVMLVVTFPDLRAEPDERPQKVSKVFVVQPMRFQPPPPPRSERIPERKAKKIPIPDPTPDEPEPIEIEDLELPEVDLPPVDATVFGIPDAPETDVFGPGQVMQVGGGVSAPEKLIAPQPRYTEEARQARIQGIVILQAIIDTEGNVAELKVLKDLTLGLTESAIETVKTWKYKPATMDGKPVPVYMNLLINFSLQ